VTFFDHETWETNKFILIVANEILDKQLSNLFLFYFILSIIFLKVFM